MLQSHSQRLSLLIMRAWGEPAHIWQRLTCGDRRFPSAAIEGKESNWLLWSSVFPSTQLLPYWDHFIDTSNVGAKRGCLALGEGCLSSLANTIADARAVCVCVCVGAEALYVTCKLQNCTDANKGKPFPGYIDPNSLVVQDEYVFVQVGNCPVCSVRNITEKCVEEKRCWVFWGICQGHSYREMLLVELYM